MITHYNCKVYGKIYIQREGERQGGRERLRGREEDKGRVLFIYLGTLEVAEHFEIESLVLQPKKKN